MPPLIRFMLVNISIGFLAGLLAGLAFIRSSMGLDFLASEPLATAMLLWSFGASFGMGALGTGLALIPRD